MAIQHSKTEVRRVARKGGYVVAALVNLAGLIIVENILGWGILAFLTEDFGRVLPWIAFSLTVSIVANLIYLINDKQPLKSTCQIGLNLISLFVTYQLFQVFPFDFSAYAFDWEALTRVVLILAMIGSGIGVVAEVLKLASGGRTREGKVLDAHGT
ncbi:hypothetical protein BH23ACT5_BH23ACT5_22260 [soil metagenome]